MGFAQFDGNAVTSNDGVLLDERRSDQRATTVFRPAIIRMGEFRSFCLVRNVSSSGMMAKVYSAIPVETPIIVEFSAHLAAAGTVVWSEDGLIGIWFNDGVNIAEILTETGKKGPGNKVNRPLRLEIDAEGEMVINGSTAPFEVLDISQRGLKARVRNRLNLNDEVLVRIIDLAPRLAVVRWTKPGEVGLNFTRPLGIDELATWVIHAQSR